jgi:hypothetical protein
MRLVNSIAVLLLNQLILAGQTGRAVLSSPSASPALILALYVDGQKVRETIDDDFQSGATGVLAGNRTTSGTDILFDNHIVLKP